LDSQRFTSRASSSAPGKRSKRPVPRTAGFGPLPGLLTIAAGPPGELEGGAAKSRAAPRKPISKRLINNSPSLPESALNGTRLSIPSGEIRNSVTPDLFGTTAIAGANLEDKEFKAS